MGGHAAGSSTRVRGRAGAAARRWPAV